jgi:phospholipid/cholesterol/gamma-HCH transport system permease protein
MVAGRISSGIASELGSMLVSEQVDAMRAFGTDPIRKLVLPRLFATLMTLPILTILADFFGMLGGFFISSSTVHLSGREYWSSVQQNLTYQDVTQGMIKPFVFAVVIAMVGCYYGLKTTGGTEGVGRSTTQAMVVASVLILVLDFFITKFLIAIGFF